MARIETANAKVRGLGAAKNGTEHFWRQRVTAIANLVLLTGVAAVLFAVMGRPFEEAAHVVRQPWAALLFVLFALNAAYHMHLGLQVVIEDYIHKHATKWALLILTGFYAAAVAAASAFGALATAL